MQSCKQLSLSRLVNPKHRVHNERNNPGNEHYKREHGLKILLIQIWGIISTFVIFENDGSGSGRSSGV